MGARGPLMLSQRPSPTTLAATMVDMVVTDSAMVMDSTMAKGPLMLSQKPSPTTLAATTGTLLTATDTMARGLLTLSQKPSPTTLAATMGTLLTATDTSMASKHVWNHSN